MTDLIYGVFEELPLTTAGTFSIDDTHDCATSTCGAVEETLTFPSDAPAGLSALVSVATQTITIDSTSVDDTMISSNLVEYTATYENCNLATETIEFTVEIECTTGSDIELTTTDSTALEFNFITDTDVSIDFTYTHAYCDPHTVTFVESTSGETLTWITSSVTDTTMTITATPTLYSEVGEYSIDAVFTDPLSSTKTNIFTLSVVEPCDFDNSNLVVTPTFTPALAPYAIDDPEATYTVTFEDTISDHFGVDFTCGKWTFLSLTDDQSDTFSAMTTVSGDSESLSWSIFSEDYYALTEDTTVTFTLSLTASEMS